MNSPQLRKERRDFRFPLHLPVLVRMPPLKEMHARSENISMGGILLSSAFPIPEGSAVEVSIGVDHTADPGILLSAQGKVLRVHPKDTGEFELAIRLDSSFTLPRSKAGSVYTVPQLFRSQPRRSNFYGRESGISRKIRSRPPHSRIATNFQAPAASSRTWPGKPKPNHAARPRSNHAARRTNVKRVRAFPQRTLYPLRNRSPRQTKTTGEG